MARPNFRGIRAQALAIAKANTAVGNGTRAPYNGAFFPPGSPMAPMAPSAAGRAFDFPTGVNLNNQPRQQEGIKNVTFELLRRLADPAQGGLDLLRAAIEKRKKDMKLQEFVIVGRNKTEGGSRAEDAMQLLRKPDGFQPWRTWLAQLLEDHFVIDAPTVYFRDQGPRVVLELIDGATIDLLLDDNGRRPMAPLDAYQQVLKGLPAVGYTVEELGYYIDNPRPGRIYGMSHVEQLVTLVTIALNRQLSVLNYYTSGSVPDMLIGVPEQWNPGQIEEFQEWWDSVLAGQLDKRRAARFYPGAMKPYETKSEILKGEFDEWLARMICFCMDLSPESLVKQTNRATAETAKESAVEQGTESTKMFVKGVVDDILERLGGGDLELQWHDEEIIDAKVKAEVIAIYVGNKPIMTIAQAREMAGMKPATPEELTEIETLGAPPPSPFDATNVGPDATNGPPGATKPAQDDTTKQAAASRGGRALRPVPPNRKLRNKTERAITALVKKALSQQKSTILTKLATLSKATGDEIAGLLGELERNPWDDSVIAKLRELLTTMTGTRAENTLDYLADYIGGTDEAYAALLTQANETAVEFARERTGNLVRGIDEASQRFLNEITSSAIEGGLTNDELAALIRDGYGFSADRAMVIARTETAIADGAGHMIGYRESGVVTGKGWDPDAEACPICEANGAQGVIGIDELFSSGDDAEPAHPNCECSVYPAIAED